MLDPIINFFVKVFNAIGRGIGWFIAVLLWPFVAFGRWYNKRGWLIKGPVGLALLALVLGYAWFVFQTQRWTNFDINYANAYKQENVVASAGDPTAATDDQTQTQTQAAETVRDQCAPSTIVTATADLIDFNVNQNNWVPSMLLSKMGLFGVPWKNTPYLDNKAAFQLGINQAVRRVSIELVDRLGRVRGTSGIDANLQKARESLAYDEDSWYFSLDPFGPRSTTQANYRSARRSLLQFNQELAACRSNFDARPDNLLQFIDRITSDIGATSDILRTRMEASNAGWFDPRADDRFWFAYGQLYAYNGILAATRLDFAEVFRNRNLEQIWLRTEEQLQAALDLQPAIISNGHEASWIMPTHLATMGFYVLRIRSNLVETRDILDR
ncbi:MAG: DUF2333 family protein [Ahrensia sp.]|nr:DUF2333 family protein [Ahrensia sp.]